MTSGNSGLPYTPRPTKFSELTEQQILALAISAEEEDSRIYADLAASVEAAYPTTAANLRQMQAEEDTHRHRLLTLYRQRYGDHIPLIRRGDVKGFIKYRPIWLAKNLRLDAVRKQAAAMEAETTRFYERAAARTEDAGIRQLLGDLAQAERGHSQLATEMLPGNMAPDAARDEAQTQARLFVLQIVQPGLAGLMDGSVSTLAPLFAAAFATQNSLDAFRVGLAASVGAGISMGFAEALSDDGALSGRGHPWIRGVVCGLMTTAGGIGHTMPYLIGNFKIATAIAVAVVIVELVIIAWIRKRYMDTPFLAAAFQVIVGGILVFLAGVAIGSY